MDILSILFGNEAKVRIMRLFLFNQETVFDIKMICEKSKVNKKIVKREISIFEKIKLIKKKDFTKINKNKKNKFTKIKNIGYYLNQDFYYITALKQLLIKTKMLENGEIVKKLSRTGKLKLIIIAGIFIQNDDSRVDLFIVGNNINKTTLNNAIKSIEAELGKELVYVYFETQDYQYRLSMYDKLIRDVLDYPHQVLLDKISG
ncbi:MAG: hypothetical protein V1910_02430 [bacterium]